jgi:hypothetical protein
LGIGSKTIKWIARFKTGCSEALLSLKSQRSFRG